jgi:alpha-tubulin suppressor-like RCC1 family protein
MSSVINVSRSIGVAALVVVAAACDGASSPDPRLRAFVQLSGGEKTTCGVTVTGDAFCWGLDFSGTLGAPAPEQCDVSDPTGGRACSTRPQRVDGGHRFRSVSAGGEHVCGLVESGDVYCWGSNITGTLGNGTRTPSSTPARVDAGPFTAVSAGLRHTCALTAGGEVDCWGDAGAGQLGVPIETLCPGSIGICGTVPVRVATTQRFAAVYAGFDATCALTSEREAWCWGSNNFGHLGDGTTRGRATPAAITGNLRFRSLSVGVASVCGITTDGAGYCWGSNIGGPHLLGHLRQPWQYHLHAGVRADAERRCALLGVERRWGVGRRDGGRSVLSEPHPAGAATGLQQDTAGGVGRVGIQRHHRRLFLRVWYCFRWHGVLLGEQSLRCPR